MYNVYMCQAHLHAFVQILVVQCTCNNTILTTYILLASQSPLNLPFYGFLDPLFIIFIHLLLLGSRLLCTVDESNNTKYTNPCSYMIGLVMCIKMQYYLLVLTACLARVSGLLSMYLIYHPFSDGSTSHMPTQMQ